MRRFRSAEIARKLHFQALDIVALTYIQIAQSNALGRSALRDAIASMTPRSGVSVPSPSSSAAIRFVRSGSFAEDEQLRPMSITSSAPRNISQLTPAIRSFFTTSTTSAAPVMPITARKPSSRMPGNGRRNSSRGSSVRPGSAGRGPGAGKISGDPEPTTGLQTNAHFRSKKLF